MYILDLIPEAHIIKKEGEMQRTVSDISFDSRQVDKNYVFVAIKGTHTDGHEFMGQAIEKGATVIICETLPDDYTEHAQISWIQVHDSSETLGIMASRLYGNPSQKLKVIGITGTNGKTTTATLLYELFKNLGYNVGLLSTIQNRIGEQIIESTHTTADALSIQKMLSQMVKKRCTHVFMEVSSHALVQKRVAGLRFQAAIFTNISHDHLDYHGTFQAYIQAKKLFFDHLDKKAFALVNQDDKRGLVMLQNCAARHYTFGLHTMSDFTARIISHSFEGLHLNIDGYEVSTRLVGEFNAYNLLTIYATAKLLEENPEEICIALSKLKGARGRFERVPYPKPLHIFVDYAHTPDALENVLTTMKEIKQEGQSITTIIGCGGNRDREKRPKMAKIAAQYSDKIILTSDNPRFEKPERIIDDMKTGLHLEDMPKTHIVIDRKKAIVESIQVAQKYEIILIAGKGHETYQEIEGKKYPFDDRQVVLDTLDA
ncbi:MAG: UDP-N-acetylmuramoyl-L-alanyl-D-glutamate--2,6-diaminopimelate ligase [Bernardetiaceae bacterium]|nr:UDP-N-acetylmuramoyl-L-alanyl-D-glutamate--2,6-diaminopimelate ligase [Bernardetiaceae bacterium]